MSNNTNSTDIDDIIVMRKVKQTITKLDPNPIVTVIPPHKPIMYSYSLYPVFQNTVLMNFPNQKKKQGKVVSTKLQNSNSIILKHQQTVDIELNMNKQFNYMKQFLKPIINIEKEIEQQQIEQQTQQLQVQQLAQQLQVQQQLEQQQVQQQVQQQQVQQQQDQQLAQLKDQQQLDQQQVQQQDQKQDQESIKTYSSTSQSEDEGEAKDKDKADNEQQDIQHQHKQQSLGNAIMDLSDPKFERRSTFFKKPQQFLFERYINKIDRDSLQIRKSDIKNIHQQMVKQFINQAYQDETQLDEYHLDNLQDESEFCNEITILDIWIKQLEIKLEFTITHSDTLNDIKHKAIQEIENIYQQKVSDLIYISQILFSVQDIDISPNNESISIKELVNRIKLYDQIKGGILSLQLKIINEISEFKIIQKLFVREKTQNDEKFRTLIKIEKKSQGSQEHRYKNRILVMKQLEDTNIQAESQQKFPKFKIVVSKISGTVTFQFHLDTVKFIQRAPLKQAKGSADDGEKTFIQKEPLETSQELIQTIRIKIQFLDDLGWEDFIIYFPDETSYLNYLFTFLESKEKERDQVEETKKAIKKVSLDKNKKKKIIDDQDYQNLMRHREDSLHITKFNVPKTSRQSIYTQELNQIIDLMNKQNQQNLDQLNKKIAESELKVIFNQCFQIRYPQFFQKKNMLMFFQRDPLELQFFDPKDNKFLFSYSYKDIQNYSELKASKIKKNKKISLNFKDQKKHKNVQITFMYEEEFHLFQQYYDKIQTYSFFRQQEINETQDSEFLKKNVKRYSWLNSPIQPLLLAKRNQAEQNFNIISLSKFKGPQKHILNLNFIQPVLTFLKMDQTVVKAIQINKIKMLEKYYMDSKRLNLILENNKLYEIVFSSVQQRIIFESSVYHLMFPNLPSIPVDEIIQQKRKKLRVFMTSYNVGDSEPHDDLNECEENLLHNFQENDIIVLGLQECHFSSWMEKLQKILKKHQYQLISYVTMWKMMICVFIKNIYTRYVTNIEVQNRATGVANMIGNKGGVMVSFKIYETSFCFISCHLAAQPHRGAMRKQHYHELIKQMRTGLKMLDNVFQFDYCFWCGDFNFRIDWPFFEVLEFIQNNDLNFLKQHCQLQKMIQNNDLFTDFIEEEINFNPTYRRLRGEQGYSNKKQQSPSWCDRIMFRAQTSYNIHCLQYSSKEFQFGSDHRPVFGIFQVEVEYPYISNPPLYCRQINDSLLKINKLIMDYDFVLLTEMNDYIGSFNYPLDISVTFYGDFLNNHPSSQSVQVKKVDDPIRWDLEQIPPIYLAIQDVNYLRNKVIILIVTMNCINQQDTVIGQCCIQLEECVKKEGQVTFFSDSVKFFGRRFGNLIGDIEFISDKQ